MTILFTLSWRNDYLLTLCAVFAEKSQKIVVGMFYTNSEYPDKNAFLSGFAGFRPHFNPGGFELLGFQVLMVPVMAIQALDEVARQIDGNNFSVVIVKIDV